MLESCGTPCGPRQHAGRGQFLDRALLVFDVVVRRCYVYFLRIAFLSARSLSWYVFVVPYRALRVVLRLRRHWGLLHCLSPLPVLLPLRNDVLSHVSKKNLEKKCFGNTAGIPKLGTRGVRWFDFSTQRTNRLRKFTR